MSTSETPETPALTRRQLRELRQTGATPIIVPPTEGETADAVSPVSQEPEAAPATTDAANTASETHEHEVPAHEVPAHEAPGGVATDAGPAEGSGTDTAPATDAPAPAIIGDVPAVASTPADAPVDGTPAPAVSDDSPLPPVDDASAAPLRPATFDGPFGDAGEFGTSGLTRRQARAQEKIRTAAVPIISPDLEPAQPHRAAAPAAEAAPAEPAQPAIFRPAVVDTGDHAVEPVDQPAPSVVNPALGSDLLEGQVPEIALPASFDQLISRNTGATGAVSTPNALILSQTPTGVPLVGPVSATGEIMITGTFELPQGLGSVGHAPGTTDGRDADAVLLDGELPPASSPTPIAASAAISTVKQPGEIIRPPAPEKGSKLLIGLIITTGALALAVVVTLALAITTGVFR